MDGRRTREGGECSLLGPTERERGERERGEREEKG